MRLDHFENLSKLILNLVGLLYNYVFWGFNERKRVDGPPRGRPLSGNSTGSPNIDEEIRQVMDERIEEAFDDRSDDVSYAEEVQQRAAVRTSGQLCCRGEDRVAVSNTYRVQLKWNLKQPLRL